MISEVTHESFRERGKAKQEHNSLRCDVFRVVCELRNLALICWTVNCAIHYSTFLQWLSWRFAIKSRPEHFVRLGLSTRISKNRKREALKEAISLDLLSISSIRWHRLGTPPSQRFTYLSQFLTEQNIIILSRRHICFYLLMFYYYPPKAPKACTVDDILKQVNEQRIHYLWSREQENANWKKTTSQPPKKREAKAEPIFMEQRFMVVFISVRKSPKEMQCKPVSALKSSGRNSKSSLINAWINFYRKSMLESEAEPFGSESIAPCQQILVNFLDFFSVKAPTASAENEREIVGLLCLNFFSEARSGMQTW